jgi:tetratricopeptide (TPR) repeat protein
LSARRHLAISGSALFAGLWLLAAGAPLLATVDPFYTSRLQEGIAAAERGSHADAARSLRIACFGMLDDEPQLADCLVRLALAQAASGDQDGFSQTFHRLVEGEELVGLYSKAGLPAELTGRFEAKVVEWIPRAALATATGFRHLAADPRESQLAALSPRARRDRLAKLEKEEPKSLRWPLLAARLEKEQNEPKAALAAAERALALAPDHAEARCLRGWGKSGVGKHAEALADLAACRGGDPVFAVAELRSRVELQQWSEAEALLATLTAEQRKLPGVGELAKRVERGAQASAPRPAPTPQPTPTSARTASSTPAAAVAPVAPATAAAAPAPTPTPAAVGPVSGALPTADETTLARVQSLLAGAKTAAEIEGAYAAAAALAARYPNHQRVQHTAAEIAYRASRWSDAVRHFRRGGDPGEGQPLLLFYFAVSLWESGSQQEAASVMRRCEGKLRPTPFVQAYRDRILGATAGS